MTYDNIREQARAAVTELLKKSHMKSGDIFIIGCSSSEIKGAGIGTDSDIDVAKAVYEGVKPLLDDRGISLAAQCCEHLNRAVIIERKALLPGQDIVNVVPQMHAGGSFAMTVYENAQDPVAVESVKADGGMDIGDTLIGMHLRPVAVPVRIAQKKSCSFYPLFDDPLGVCMPANHPLAEKEEVDISDLNDCEFIMPLPGWDDLYDIVYQTEPFSPTISHYVASDRGAVAMVASNLGISILPELQAKCLPHNTTWRKFSANCSRTLGYCITSMAHASPALRKFIAIINEKE